MPGSLGVAEPQVVPRLARRLRAPLEHLAHRRRLDVRGAGVDLDGELVLGEEALELEGREGGGHARMIPRTSSRRASMSACETRLSRLSRSSGSVFDGRTLKCQSS